MWNMTRRVGEVQERKEPRVEAFLTALHVTPLLPNARRSSSHYILRRPWGDGFTDPDPCPVCSQRKYVSITKGIIYESHNLSTVTTVLLSSVFA